MNKFLESIYGNKVILGTSSVYRQEIFKKLNIPFEIRKSDFEENLDKSLFKTP